MFKSLRVFCENAFVTEPRDLVFSDYRLKPLLLTEPHNYSAKASFQHRESYVSVC